MSASEPWLRWLWWVGHECRSPTSVVAATIKLLKQGRLDSQSGLRVLERNLQTWRDIHAVLYPPDESGVAQDASAPPGAPQRTSGPLDGDRLAMPAAPDVFVQFLRMSASEYGGLVESCASMLDELARHDARREAGLQILERQVRTLSELYSALEALARARSGFSLKEAVFVAIQLVQFPIDIQTSGDCDARWADTMLPIALAMLLWVQPHDGDRNPFLEISCAADGARIVVAPDRTVCGPDFVEMQAHGDSSPDWLRAVATALADSGYAFVVRSNGRLATFTLSVR